MKNRLLQDSYHRLNIMRLMYFRPAKLFNKINELPWYQETLQTWSDSLGYHGGESVLEVGCASGQLTKYWATRGAIATGVDKSPQMLQLANASSTHGAHFKLASALDLPVQNSQFDYVIAASLINIISEPATAMKEMVRACKQGGTVSVLVSQAGMKDADVTRLADDLDLSGFSRAALTAWHRRAPKMQREKLLQYFSQAGLQQACSNSYLNGLVLTVTATRNAGA